MSTVSCPGCGGRAERQADGTIVCDDGYDRYEMGPEELANIAADKKFQSLLSSGMSVEQAWDLVIERWDDS